MPYNFAAESFHTKELCSRLSSRKALFFIRKSEKFHFRTETVLPMSLFLFQFLFTGTRIRIDSVMHPRSSSRGRNTSAPVTVTVTVQRPPLGVRGNGRCSS